MTTDTKKLAKFIPEFLGLPKSDKVKPGEHTEFPDIFLWKLEIELGVYHIGPQSFFDDAFGPILAHLAKREIKSRGWDINYRTYDATHDYTLEKELDDSGEKIDFVDDQNENEFIALWSAIEATGEK